MISKEEMINHIDKSIDTLKEDLKKYIDEFVKENKAEYILYLYDKYFKYNESLYNIDPNKIKLGDVVFGIVSKDRVEDDRYPFRVIYKSNDKLILLGIKRLDDCSFSKAYDLRWNVAYYLNKKPYIQSNCSVISRELIDQYTTDECLDLATGFPYWTKSIDEDESIFRAIIDDKTLAWSVNSDGTCSYDRVSTELYTQPCVIINLKENIE